MTNLLQWGRFTSAAGSPLDWKIECDALTKEDWDCIAQVMIPHLPSFGCVVGVPRGGYPMATAFSRGVTFGGSDPVLIVDDVWTTGKSMTALAREVSLHVPWVGCVLFARNPTPPNVRAMFTLNFK